mgnify:CR=1 FL=1
MFSNGLKKDIKYLSINEYGRIYSKRGYKIVCGYSFFLDHGHDDPKFSFLVLSYLLISIY